MFPQYFSNHVGPTIPHYDTSFGKNGSIKDNAALVNTEATKKLKSVLTSLHLCLIFDSAVDEEFVSSSAREDNCFSNGRADGGGEAFDFCGRDTGKSCSGIGSPLSLSLNMFLFSSDLPVFNL